MPYKDPKKRYERTSQAAKERRSIWFKEHGPCAKCGSEKNLDVHHKDPSQKVSHRIWSWSQKRREEELVKCEPLCEPCHEKLHNPGTHGTQSRYRVGCRCSECISANVKAWREYRARKKLLDPMYRRKAS